MGIFEKCIVIIIYAIATITLVTNEDDVYPKFYTDMIKHYNLARALHSANKLHLDNELCDEAMENLNKVVNGEANVNDNNWYYNIVELEGTEQPTAKEVFNSMYETSYNYDYNYEDILRISANFTNIVWKGTEMVGFAILNKNQTYYFSAIYRPIGNVGGTYSQNVGPPKYNDLHERFLDLIQ